MDTTLTIQELRELIEEMQEDQIILVNFVLEAEEDIDGRYFKYTGSKEY